MNDRIATLEGHLTATNRQHIKAILDAGLTEGKVNRITYKLTHEGFGTYTVDIYMKDRGFGGVGTGDKLRMSRYTSRFVMA